MLRFFFEKFKVISLTYFRWPHTYYALANCVIMIEVDVKCQYVQKNLNNCQSGALIKELLLREETLLPQ